MLGFSSNHLRTYYLPWIHEYGEFAVNTLRNFGTRASSRVESAHRAIKRFLRNRLTSLDQLYEAIRRACTAQKVEYLWVGGGERGSSLPKFVKVRIFEELLYRVSAKGMDFMWRQKLDSLEFPRTARWFLGCPQ